MAAYPPPPFYLPYQYPPVYPPQSPRRGGAPQNSARSHHPQGYHHPYPVQHDHHPHHLQQHQQQHHQQQQQQQQHHQQHYPLAHPHPTKYMHYGPHHSHHPGYPPYQPQPPPATASPTFAQQWQAQLGHVTHHQQQQQQPLSPLPKQLGVMPLPPHPIPSHIQPRGMSPAYFDLQNQKTPSIGSSPAPPAAASSSARESVEVEEAPLIIIGDSMSPAVEEPMTTLETAGTDAPMSSSPPQQHQAVPKVLVGPTITQPVSTYKQTGTISITSPSMSNIASSPASPISPASRTSVISSASPIASESPRHSAAAIHAAFFPTITTPTTSTASSATTAAKTTRTVHKPKPKAIWAIWSRRPQNPSDAPGIIISPSARPPPEVVQQALTIYPPSPPAEPFSPSARIVTLDDGGGGSGLKGPPIVPGTPVMPTTKVEGDNAEGVALSSEPTDSTVPSSSASVTEGLTDLTDAPTLPGSPASSTTSVSVGQNGKEGPSYEKYEETEKKREEKEVEAPSVDEPAEEISAGPVAVTADASTVAAEASAQETFAAPSTITASTAPAQPPLTKSWASLLKPSSSSSGSGPVKNALPTSRVVGISVPASATASSSPFGSSVGGERATPGRKAELLALLTHGPGGILNATGNYATAAAGGGSNHTHTSQSQVQGGRLRPRGLINSGNMCFANSVLQMLVYTLPFQRLFSEIRRLNGVRDPKEVGKEANGTPLVDAMVKFVGQFVVDAEAVVPGAGINGNANVWGKGKERDRSEDDDELWGGESFVPSYVYEAMKEKKRFDNMRGGQQEDAEEFLGFLLESLEEELVLLKETLLGSSSIAQGKPRPVEEREEAASPEERGWQEVGKKNRTVVTRTIKSTESAISKMFGGKFRTTLRVPKKDSVIVEDWRSVRLDIQRDQIHTVQDALAFISHPQPVQVTNPSRPGTTLEAQQQVHIDALPPVLILHMKRFCYDTSVGDVVKVSKQVRFGPELEIVNDVIAPGIRKSFPPKYKLFGVLYHHGLSASGGHYTLDVLHPSRFISPGGKAREGWIRIDDELVSDVRSEDVFGGEKDENRCAYLLFYKRIR